MSITSIASKLAKLANYKVRILRVFDKVITRLEKTNQRLETLNAKAILELNALEKLLEDGNIQFEENKKILEKFRDLIK